MKTKIRTILLYSMAVLLLLFLVAFIFRFLIDYGCYAPWIYSVHKFGNDEIGSFLGVRCDFWNRVYQIQYNR